MGEISPPTAADYAMSAAMDNGQQLKKILLKLNQLQTRVEKLEVALTHLKNKR